MARTRNLTHNSLQSKQLDTQTHGYTDTLARTNRHGSNCATAAYLSLRAMPSATSGFSADGIKSLANGTPWYDVMEREGILPRRPRPGATASSTTATAAGAATAEATAVASADGNPPQPPPNVGKRRNGYVDEGGKAAVMLQSTQRGAQ